MGRDTGLTLEPQANTKGLRRLERRVRANARRSTDRNGPQLPDDACSQRAITGWALLAVLLAQALPAMYLQNDTMLGGPAFPPYDDFQCHPRRCANSGRAAMNCQGLTPR